MPPTKRQPELAFAVARSLGADPFDPDGFRSLVVDHGAAFARRLAASTMQTNDPRRMAPIVPVIGAIAARSAAPIGLVEIGASAGLTLIPDRVVLDFVPEGDSCGRPVRIASPLPADRVGTRGLTEACGTAGFASAAAATLPLTAVTTGVTPEAVPPFRLVARVGLDPSPIDLRDPAAFSALAWSVPPEAVERVALMRSAASVLLADPPTLITGTVQHDLDRALAQLPENCTPVVVTAGTLVYVPGRERQAFVDAIADRGVHWISLERTGALVDIASRLPTNHAAAVPADRAFATLAVDGNPIGSTDPYGTRIHWFAQP